MPACFECECSPCEFLTEACRAYADQVVEMAKSHCRTPAEAREFMRDMIDERNARELVRKHVLREDDGPTRRARLSEEPTEEEVTADDLADALITAAHRRD